MEILGFINILAYIIAIWCSLTIGVTFHQFTKLSPIKQKYASYDLRKEILGFIISITFIIWYW